MTGRGLQRWAAAFRKAASDNRYRLMEDHLDRLELAADHDPENVVEGTILLMHACAAYAAMDNRPFKRFLGMQSYDPAQATGADYVLTFDLYGHALARVMVNAKLETIDLADLYGHPWMEYRSCGYSTIYITRADGKDLDVDEVEQLEEAVTEDLRFDYGEDELDFWFDDMMIDGALIVRVQDHEE